MTGELGVRRPVDPNSFYARMRNQRGVVDDEDLVAPERGEPVLENQRLTVKNLRTDAVAWTSPPDLAIAGHRVMPGGLVLTETTDAEWLLLDGKNGKILCRTEKARFSFSSAMPSMTGDAVFAIRRMEGGTNEVLVLDPAGGSTFRGIMPPRGQPLASLGPTLPDQLLVRMDMNPVTKKHQRLCLPAGAETGGGTDPRAAGADPRGARPDVEDLRDASAQYQYAPYFAGGLILMVDGQGEVLAYEHDP